MTDIPELLGRLDLQSNSITIRNPKIADSGNYTCSINDTTYGTYEEARIRVIGMMN